MSDLTESSSESETESETDDKQTLIKNNKKSTLDKIKKFGVPMHGMVKK